MEDSDPEYFAEMMEILTRKPLQWEIFFSDYSSVKGTTIAEWDAAPSTDVQVVVWQDESQQVTVIGSLETFRGKSGNWMPDDEYDALLKWVRFNHNL